MTNAAVADVSRRFRRKNADTAFRTGWPPQTPFVDEPHRRMDRERHRQPPMSTAMRSLDRACGDRVMPRLPFRNPVAVRSKHSRIDAYLHHICCSHITAMDAPRLRRQSETRPQAAATQEISRDVQQTARITVEVASNIIDVSRGASATGYPVLQCRLLPQAVPHHRSSWPGLSRPSTSCFEARKKDVDGRHEAGHDVEGVDVRQFASSRGFAMFEPDCRRSSPVMTGESASTSSDHAL